MADQWDAFPESKDQWSAFPASEDTWSQFPEASQSKSGGGVLTQAGIGAQQGFWQLGEAGNALLQALTQPIIKLGPISITPHGLESTQVAEAMSRQFGGAADVAAGRSEALEQQGEQAGGPRFARRLAAGAMSIAPAVAAAPIGIPAAVLAGALQSFGSEFSAQQRALRARGFTDQEAALKSYAPSLASGLSTIAATILGGRIAPGVEGWTQAIRSPEFRKAAMEFLKNAGAEAGEEALDQLGQSVVQKLTRRPELTTKEALSESLEAGVIGGILGGGMAVAGRVSRTQPAVEQARAANAPRTAQAVSEITPRAIDLTQENVLRQGEPISATLTLPTTEIRVGGKLLTASEKAQLLSATLTAPAPQAETQADLQAQLQEAQAALEPEAEPTPTPKQEPAIPENRFGSNPVWLGELSKPENADIADLWRIYQRTGSDDARQILTGGTRGLLLRLSDVREMIRDYPNIYGKAIGQVEQPSATAEPTVAPEPAAAAPEPAPEATAPAPESRPSESQYLQSKVDWGLQNLPFGETAKLKEGENAYKVMTALDAAGISVGVRLKMIEGRLRFPTKEEFTKGVNNNYYGLGAQALQKVRNELSTLGLDVKRAKLPKVDDFSSPREFYDAAVGLERRMRQEGISLMSALVETKQIEKPFTKEDFVQPTPEATVPAAETTEIAAEPQAPTVRDPLGNAVDFYNLGKLRAMRMRHDPALERAQKFYGVDSAEALSRVAAARFAERQASLEPQELPQMPAAVKRVVLRQPKQRPWDIIDEIESAVGQIRTKSAARAGSEGYYGELYKEARGGSASRLFSDTGGSPDEAVDTLRNSGFFSQDASVDDMWIAIAAAKKARAAHFAGASPEAKLDKFTKAWDAQVKKKGSQTISVGDLAIGNTFHLGGEEFTVKAIDPDTGEVTVQDGWKYGSQTIPDGSDVPIEKGSLKQKAPSTAFLPEETRQKVAQLRSGEQQGDILANVQEPFALAAEKGIDYAKREQERLAEQQRKSEAARIQEEQQRRLFGMSPTPPGLGEEVTAPSVEDVRAQRALEQRRAVPPVIPPSQLPPPVITPPPGSAAPIVAQDPNIVGFDKNKDYTTINNLNSGQWNFYFGRLGERAQRVWTTMALTEMKMRENIAKDIAIQVDDVMASLPAEMRKDGGKPMFQALDGKTEEEIVQEWAGKPGGQAVIAAATRVKRRLEEIRQDIRDTKKVAYHNYLIGIPKATLEELYQQDVDSDADVVNMTSGELAMGLAEQAYPADWGISDGSYIPHIFFGNWVVSITKPGDDKPAFVTRARTPHEARVQIQQYVKANPDLANAKFSVKPDMVMPADMVRLSDPKFFKLVNEMKDKFSVTTTDVREATQGLIGRKATKQKWFGNLQQRLGAKNYSENFRDVMTSYLYGYHRWKNLSALQNATAPLIDKIRSEEGRRDAASALEGIMDNLWGKPTKSTTEFDNLIQRIPILKDRVQPLALDRWSKNLRSLLAGLHLTTLRFGVLNRLQPLLGLYPIVGEKGIVQAKLMQHTAAGRELLERYNVDYDIGQYGEAALKSRLGKARERVTGEKSNQEIAFLAMYQHGINQGLSEADAANYAKLRGQLMTQFMPLTSDTPAAFQGPIASTVFQYKRFPIKQLELVGTLLKEGNVTGLARMALMYSLMGGMAFWARQLMFGHKDEQKRWKNELEKALGTEGANAVWYGLPGLLNADLSGSLTVAEPPMGDSIYEQVGRTALGPLGSTAVRIGQVALKEDRERQDAVDKAANMLRAIPALRPIAELIDLQRGNVDLRSPDGEIRYRRTLKDVFAGLGSFRTASESNTELAVQASIAVEKERDQLKNRYYVASQGTSQEIANARADIDEFNARWPERKIVGSELGEYVRSRKKKSKQTDVQRMIPRKAQQLLPQEQRR